MLVLSRKVGETIFIGDDIEIIVTRIEPSSVRIALLAPKEVPIFRGELLVETQDAPERTSRRSTDG